MDKFPISPRELCEYTDEKVVRVDDRLYVPISTTNSLFDAFFFQVVGPSVIVWVLQISINVHEGPGSSRGYCKLGKIKEIADKAIGPRGQVEFRYVLVEPKLNDPDSITYSLPQNTAAANWISGKVYLQLLAVAPHERDKVCDEMRDPWATDVEDEDAD
ncbi:hypothetical protein K435DRAFT_112268 [Dendrothele bispora CBS 962.96]|uniref:Uncharacterized protein n=1 Tax=Dendrothele bispora (strain CBS 962.96) TaxID=1314807 RepID=A0A4S8M1G0_DENBC|nr:hypothetical protein K435DRAFT_112268 [Dendrothele bispora CBS 962.96]